MASYTEFAMENWGVNFDAAREIVEHFESKKNWNEFPTHCGRTSGDGYWVAWIGEDNDETSIGILDNDADTCEGAGIEPGVAHYATFKEDIVRACGMDWAPVHEALRGHEAKSGAKPYFPADMRVWRLSAGLSHAKAAERLGVTPDAIYKWENGLRAPANEKAVRALMKAEERPFWTRDHEAGNKIDSFRTREDAEKAIEKYEADDKEEGTYVPNFYEVFPAEDEE